MAAFARFHLRQPSPPLKPSAILSNFGNASPFFTIRTSNNSNLCHNRGGGRKLSTISPVGCNSESSTSSTESIKSIVGDLLDYLNESWTQFHATEVYATTQEEGARHQIMNPTPVTNKGVMENPSHNTTVSKAMETVARSAKGKSKSSRFFCEHCDKEGHPKDQCQILHPYLENSIERGQEVIMMTRNPQNTPAEFQSRLESIAMQFQQRLQAQRENNALGPAGPRTKLGHLVQTSGSYTRSRKI